ncbi:hypothetical protein SFA64_00085 [Escherichia coli]|nr:hypothetical protein [Escherichia coli]
MGKATYGEKHHYFAEGEITSICGGWMYFGNEREPDTFESPDDCKKCRRKLNKGVNERN